jgi:hypothetical protein
LGANPERDENDRPLALVPYDKREAITVHVAARIAGRPERTVRFWCEVHNLGRRIGNGPWAVSRVALRAFLDGDALALRLYLAGDRSHPRVVALYEREGIGALPRQWEASDTVAA